MMTVGFMVAALAFLSSESPVRLSGTLSAEFETAYVSPSGTICDSRPTALQNLDWMLTLGDYGRFSGYGAFLSMLHDYQHELHRPAFNEFEGSIRYGYAWTLAKDVVFVNDAGFVAILFSGIGMAMMSRSGSSGISSRWRIPM